tara:strand:- start:102 stop:1109 length:1008 start_codon:yes stop_codon:yes gene_type:complete
MIRYLSTSFLFSFVMATFSIVAVDTTTGEVGSAGGSCIAGSIIISDIHPGTGVIHTQSYYLPANQSYASSLMDEGYSPDEIIELLENNDVQNNPAIRQYGVVDLFSGNDYGLLYEYECEEIEGAVWQGIPDSGELAECSDPVVARSASFTGSNCSSWKGHINGVNYAIQGNILLNENILLGLERGFNLTNGSLDQKLMAAMQEAKFPGADTRCLDEGISTLSAFIRVAKPTDMNEYYMDLNVNSVIPYYTENGIWIDPIDTLQTLYDNWYGNDFNYEIGDVNQDSMINILDIVAVANGILDGSISGIAYYLADINGDDLINILDIIQIVNIILYN